MKFCDLPEIEGIFLQYNPMRSIPIYNWSGNKLNELKIYFRGIEQGGETKNYKAKIILLGKGDVGKSTLMKRLENKNISLEELKKVKQTNGIQITPLTGVKLTPSPDNKREYEFEINMWDFGGQEIQRNIHQFFITENALYLLLWTVRNAENKYRYFKEWLNVIETYSGVNSRVILIQNRLDEGEENIDRESLQKIFKSLKSFANVSALHGTGFEEEGGLRARIKKELLALPKVGETLSINWVNIKDEIEKLKNENKNTLSLKAFNSLCKANSINEEGEVKLVLNWLHQIGVILYYRNPSPLWKTLILNPQWITQSVYKILLDENGSIGRNRGKFTYKYVYELLDGKSEEIIIQLMEKFNLCFKLENQEFDEYVVPILLPVYHPKKVKEIDWEGIKVEFEYHYLVMPYGAISRFISLAYHNGLIQENLFWKNGVVLTYKSETKALVNI